MLLRMCQYWELWLILPTVLPTWDVQHFLLEISSDVWLCNYGIHDFMKYFERNILQCILRFTRRKNYSSKDYLFLLLFQFIKFFFCQRFFLQCFLVNFHIFFHLWWWKSFLYINQTRNSLCKSIYFVSWSIHQQFVEQILLMLKVIIIALYTSRIMCKLSCNSLYPAI